MTVKGLKQLPLLRGPSRWTASGFSALESPPPKGNANGARQPVEVANLIPKPGRDVDRLLSEPDSNQLLVARCAYGMGKVNVVAFDRDRPPFTSWVEKGQNEFWKKILTETAPSIHKDAQASSQRSGVPGQAEGNDLGTALQENLESFSDMPVISSAGRYSFSSTSSSLGLSIISFKKVVKRLELT